MGTKAAAKAKAKVPKLSLKDIHGKPVEIGNGRRVLLSMFREATCPFCNFRVDELTNSFPEVGRMELDVVVVFKSEREDIVKFIANQPRPFRMVADPEGNAHRKLHGRSSIWGKIKAMLFRVPEMLKGKALIGRKRSWPTGSLMPAEFLIDEDGVVVEAHYGRDSGDHISLSRVERFAALARKTPGSELSKPRIGSSQSAS